MSAETAGAPSLWKGRRVLITGFGGFTGRHLAAELARLGAAVTGIDRIELTAQVPGVYHRMDILDGPRLTALFEIARPDVIFHLAALLRSDDPAAYYTVNAGGTAVLFESVSKASILPLTVLLSSGAVYGPSLERAPIRETQPLRPHSHYALSKLAQEWIAARFHEEYGLSYVTCRPFNLSGPGLPPTLALSSFARQIACVERDGARDLRVGRLDGRRDFVDVRDAVHAYLAVAETGEPGAAYNVCSGESRSISACLDVLLKYARVKVRVEQAPVQGQLGDVDDQVGDPDRIRKATGWAPAIPVEQSIRDMLDYWRERENACG